MLLFNSSLKSQNLIIILFCCIIWCEMTWVVYFIVNLCFHNFTMNPRIFKVPKYLYPTFFITKICQKLLFFLLLLKFINIALVNIREFSVQDIYMHIPSITNFGMHRSCCSTIFLFSIIWGTIFPDSKILDCIHCLQSYIACFPLISGHVMVIFKVQNQSEKCLLVR